GLMREAPKIGRTVVGVRSIVCGDNGVTDAARRESGGGPGVAVDWIDGNDIRTGRRHIGTYESQWSEFHSFVDPVQILRREAIQAHVGACGVTTRGHCKEKAVLRVRRT